MANNAVGDGMDAIMKAEICGSQGFEGGLLPEGQRVLLDKLAELKLIGSADTPPGKQLKFKRWQFDGTGDEAGTGGAVVAPASPATSRRFYAVAEVLIPAAHKYLAENAFRGIDSSFAMPDSYFTAEDGTGYYTLSGSPLDALVAAVSDKKSTQGGGMGSGVSRGGKAEEPAVRAEEPAREMSGEETAFIRALRTKRHEQSLEFQMSIGGKGWLLKSLRELAGRGSYFEVVSVISEEEYERRQAEREQAVSPSQSEPLSITVVVKPDKVAIDEEKGTFRLDMEVSRIEVRGMTVERLRQATGLRHLAPAEEKGALLLTEKNIFDIATAPRRARSGGPGL